MSWRRELSKIGALFRRPKPVDDLAEEIRSHLEMEKQENLESGMPPVDAHYAALRRFGNVTLAQERSREMWRWNSVETLWQDLRYGLRMLLKNPGFTAVAVLTLALGIGANTAIFSVVNTVLLRALPYKDADRLVMVWGLNRPRGFDTDQVSPLDFADWKSQNRVFESMAASTDAMYTLTGAGDPTSIIGYQFSSDYFHVLGVEPLLGRTFLPEEEQPGKNHVAVLGYPLWQSRFGGDSGVVGKTVTLDGEPYTVIGIMPSGYQFPQDTQLWTPLTIPQNAATDRAYRFLRVVARLKPGVKIQQAQNEMNTITSRLANQYPSTNKDEGTNIIGLRQMTTGDIRPALLVLLCAVGFVLLIACANVANLFLARAVARQRETSIRAALGATQFRLVRQFLTESVALGLVGGAFGLFLAVWAAGALVAMFPRTISNLNIPRIDRIPTDRWVLGFALAASLLTGIFFGLFPALRAGSLNNEALKESSRALSGGLRARRFRSSLVVAEVALSLVLLVGAGVTLRSLVHLLQGDLGFNPENVLTLRVLLPTQKYKTESQWLAFGDQAIDRIKSLPGVQSVGTVTFLPLSGWWGTRRVVREGARVESPDSQPPTVWSSVTPEYFSTMAIPLLKGRFFSDQDNQKAASVTIISQSLAQRLWPGSDPIGKRVTIQGFKLPREIVGVVGNVRQLGITSEIMSEVYVPFSQAPPPLLCFAIRTATEPTSLAKAAQREIWAVDKDQAVGYVMSMGQLASESLAPQRVITILLSVFAGAALLLAAIGLYGVISHSVTQRLHELGLRMALGAARSDVMKLVLGEGLRLALLGIGIGVLGAFALTRFMSSLLYGVRPTDPATLAGVSLLLAVVALLAGYIPARRAAKIDPMVALRYE